MIRAHLFLLLFASSLSLCLLFPLPVQKPQTDREFDRLKGPVNTIITKAADVKRTGGKLVESKLRMEDEAGYDADGNITYRKHYEAGDLFGSTKYLRADGDKVSIEESVGNEIVTARPVSARPAKPVQHSDSRYTYKFKYKYDSAGNVTEEAWYQNDGSLWTRYVYKMHGNRTEELGYSEDGSLESKYMHVFDDKGNEVELHIYDTEKDSVESKETYQYGGFDSKGNWTKRIVSEGDSEHRFAMKLSKVEYRIITYF